VPLCSAVLVSSLVAVSLLACSCLDPHRLPLQSQVLLRHLSAHLHFRQFRMGSHLDLGRWVRCLDEVVAAAGDVDMGWLGKVGYSLGGRCCLSCESVLGRLARIRGLVR